MYFFLLLLLHGPQLSACENATKSRQKRVPHNDFYIVEPSSVVDVKQLWDIEELKTTNLANYISAVADDSPEGALKTLRFLAKYGLIPNKQRCPNGKSDMSLTYDRSKARYYWRCTEGKKITKKDSFFEPSKLSLQKVVFLMANFVENPKSTIRETAARFNMDKETVYIYYQFFRDLTVQFWWRESEDKTIKFGGPGKRVEIDETLLFRAKYNRGRMLIRDQIWVFGLIERGSNKVAMFRVEDRKAVTLLPIIEKYVESGSTVISDGWASYGGIRHLAGLTHHWVNHRINFVNPTNPNIHTQSIEASWGALKRDLKGMYGFPQHNLEGYLHNYMWRRYHDRKKLLNHLLYELSFYRIEIDDSAPDAPQPAPIPTIAPMVPQPAPVPTIAPIVPQPAPVPTDTHNSVEEEDYQAEGSDREVTQDGEQSYGEAPIADANAQAALDSVLHHTSGTIRDVVTELAASRVSRPRDTVRESSADVMPPSTTAIPTTVPTTTVKPRRGRPTTTAIPTTVPTTTVKPRRGRPTTTAIPTTVPTTTVKPRRGRPTTTAIPTTVPTTTVKPRRGRPTTTAIPTTVPTTTVKPRRGRPTTTAIPTTVPTTTVKPRRGRPTTTAIPTTVPTTTVKPRRGRPTTTAIPTTVPTTTVKPRRGRPTTTAIPTTVPTTTVKPRRGRPTTTAIPTTVPTTTGRPQRGRPTTTALPAPTTTKKPPVGGGRPKPGGGRPKPGAGPRKHGNAR